MFKIRAFFLSSHAAEYRRIPYLQNKRFSLWDKTADFPAFYHHDASRASFLPTKKNLKAATDRPFRRDA
ncbi:hypothetical protein [uncultured Akkermansia sp.]|uniref:hypothetical protein n=1 Tax=uncultured Akkermansia sp. TaxID=512294 RepID=UPI00262B3C32|nr:hypothetical protein [uncultured Akkermansia sp.]